MTVHAFNILATCRIQASMEHRTTSAAASHEPNPHMAVDDTAVLLRPASAGITETSSRAPQLSAPKPDSGSMEPPGSSRPLSSGGGKGSAGSRIVAAPDHFLMLLQQQAAHMRSNITQTQPSAAECVVS